MIESVIKCDVCGHSITTSADLSGWFAISASSNEPSAIVEVSHLDADDLNPLATCKHICSIPCVAKELDALFNTAKAPIFRVNSNPDVALGID